MLITTQLHKKSEFNGSGNMKLHFGNDSIITACVEDDGGVQEKNTSSISSYYFPEEEITQQTRAGLAVLETSPMTENKRSFRCTDT
jgi:hypothetical protein